MRVASAAARLWSAEQTMLYSIRFEEIDFEPNRNRRD